MGFMDYESLDDVKRGVMDIEPLVKEYIESASPYHEFVRDQYKELRIAVGKALESTSQSSEGVINEEWNDDDETVEEDDDDENDDGEFNEFIFIYKYSPMLTLLKSGIENRHITFDDVCLNAPKNKLLYYFQIFSHTFSDIEYWKQLAYLYIQQDFEQLPFEFYKMLFSSNREERIHLMNTDEQKYFQALPDTITIYRGMSQKEAEDGNYGISWTLNRSVADFFAEKYFRNSLYKEEEKKVVELSIPKTKAIAYFNGRKEEEVIYIHA